MGHIQKYIYRRYYTAGPQTMVKVKTELVKVKTEVKTGLVKTEVASNFSGFHGVSESGTRWAS